MGHCTRASDRMKNVLTNTLYGWPRLCLLLVALVTFSGCACRLSGTPLDTVEKNVNPACWSS